MSHDTVRMLATQSSQPATSFHYETSQARLLLFRSIAGTCDLLSKHALVILQWNVKVHDGTHNESLRCT